jgi:SAM-dependent methyltransferase
LKCRHCTQELKEKFLDLGVMPPSNAYISQEDLEKPEPKYPLRLLVCTNCWLVQTEDFVGRGELFNSEYAYFSSTSKSWLEHAADFCEKIIPQLGLGSKSLVVEIASNDGYLLKNFLSAGIPCLGIEPTASTAAAAEALGIPVIREFFGEKLGRALAAEGKQADLIIGNNVFAHVPDINDFAKGLKALLKHKGTITLEFPHLMKMIEYNQFDTAYHEHFSYLSLGTAKTILEKAGLSIWDVQELATHGGSLRIFAGHSNEEHPKTAAMAALMAEEKRRGMQKPDLYQTFQDRADRIRNEFRSFLEAQKASGQKVAAYGAAAKGNTLLNFAEVREGLLPAVYDAAPSKQYKFMPGSRIPIRPTAEIEKDRPDCIIILPWNIADEIRQQNPEIEKSGARFVTAIPEVRIL